MTNHAIHGRAFTAMQGTGERVAFGRWLGDCIRTNGGRMVVAESTGISKDNLSKWANGRSIPSKINIKKLIETNVIPYASLEDLVAHSPWLEGKYRKVPRAASNREVALNTVPQPTETTAPVRHNLMDAVLAEPGLSVQQRAQLAALITMVVNGVNIDIAISPRSKA